jgi:hypothetical protein
MHDASWLLVLLFSLLLVDQTMHIWRLLVLHAVVCYVWFPQDLIDVENSKANYLSPLIVLSLLFQILMHTITITIMHMNAHLHHTKDNLSLNTLINQRQTFTNNIRFIIKNTIQVIKKTSFYSKCWIHKQLGILLLQIS